MAKKKKALGRGLKSLIPVDGNDEVLSDDAKQKSNFPLRDIPLSKIDSNPTNPRKNFNEETLTELAETLKRLGLIQPITVQQKGDRYQIIAGERRFRASKIAGFTTIPGYIKKISSKDNAIMSLVENIQRENLDVIEEAEHFQLLKDEFKMKQSEIASIVGKNRATVTNKLRILAFPQDVKDLLSDRAITEGQVRPLLAIRNKDTQTSLAKKIAKEKWSARKVEDEVRRLMEPAATSKKKSKRKDPEVRRCEDSIRAKLGTKVTISHNEKTGKGKISIDYFSSDDLERIVEMIEKAR